MEKILFLLGIRIFFNGDYCWTIVDKDGNGEDLELGLMIGEMRGSVGQWWK